MLSDASPAGKSLVTASRCCCVTLSFPMALGEGFDSGEAPKFKPKFAPLTAEQMVIASHPANPPHCEPRGPFISWEGWACFGEDRVTTWQLTSPRLCPQAGRVQLRRVPVPAHRMTPLKKDWIDITTPIVKHMKLQVRMNLKRKAVELKTSDKTTDPGAIQKVRKKINIYDPLLSVLIFLLSCRELTSSKLIFWDLSSRMLSPCFVWTTCTWIVLS